MRRRQEHQYLIDGPLLERLSPEVVVNQELCSVCAASHPEVVVVMPCSFDLERIVREVHLLTSRPGWEALSAVKTGRVFGVETALFHRPGPRLLQGLKVLAGLLHPDRFPEPAADHARRLP